MGRVGTGRRGEARGGRTGGASGGRSRRGASARVASLLAPLAPLAARVLTAARGAETLGAVLVGCAVGAAYVATLLPGVYTFGDTTKFQYLGKVLGTPHPTGYPTYLVLNGLFVRLWPFGSLAWKANLLSALFATAAVLVLFKLLRALRLDPFLAVVTALAFGFTRTVWSQAVIAEVYTLNLLFVAATLSRLVAWHLRRRDRDLLAGLAVYALSFGNHLTMITFLPAIAWLILTTDASVVRRPRYVAATLGFVALGALQYGYVFWRTLVARPGFLEMRAGDPAEFWWWISGGPFRGQMFAFPVREAITDRLPMFADLFGAEYGPLTAIVLLGAATFRNARLNVFFGLGAAGNVFYAINYDVGDVFVYFIPTYFVAAIYLGLGLARLGRPLGRLGTALAATGRRWGIVPPPVAARPSAIPVRAGLLLVPWLLVLANLRAVDQSGNRSAAVATESVLREVGRNAVVVTAGYHYSDYQSLMYYLAGEGRARENVRALWSAPPEAVVAYLCQDRPLLLPFQNETVPPGWAVYALRPPAGVDRVGLCTETGPDCAFAFGPGWHDPETTDQLWRRRSDGAGVIRVFAERAMEVGLAGALEAVRSPDRVDVLVNGRLARTLDVGLGETLSLGSMPLRVDAGENLVEFRPQDPAGRAGGDPGRGSVVVHGLGLTDGGAVPACDLLL